MHELSKEVAAKLARCTLRSGAPEDEILSRCRELGLAIEPIGHYYDKVSAPASKRQAPSEAKAQVKTSKVAKQVVDLSQIKHRSYPATGDAAKTPVTTLSSTSSECKNPVSACFLVCVCVCAHYYYYYFTCVSNAAFICLHFLFSDFPTEGDVRKERLSETGVRNCGSTKWYCYQAVEVHRFGHWARAR